MSAGFIGATLHANTLDIYDSYTYNLHDLISRVNGREQLVVRADTPLELSSWWQRDEILWTAQTSLIVAQIVMKFCRNFADNLEKC